MDIQDTEDLLDQYRNEENKVEVGEALDSLETWGKGKPPNYTEAWVHSTQPPDEDEEHDEDNEYPPFKVKGTNPIALRNTNHQRQSTSDIRSLTIATTTEDTRHLILGIRIGRHRLEAMIDSGAQGNFISPRVVNRCRIHWKKKERPYQLTRVEGTPDGKIENETIPALIQY